MSKANLKRWAFNLFLKSVMSETVRKSAGREFHAAGPENDKVHSPNLYVHIQCAVDISCLFITSVKEVMFSSFIVCLSVSDFAQKLPNEYASNFQARLANGPMNKLLNFGGDSDHHLDTGIVFRIRYYWEIRKVVNGHESAAASSHSFTLIRQMAGLILRHW